MEEWGISVHSTKSGLEWHDGLGRSEIRVEARNAVTRDGLKIVGLVSFRHIFNRSLQHLITLDRVATWNRLATLSAISQVPDTGQYALQNRVTLYQGDEDAWQRIHTPMLAMESYLQPRALLYTVYGRAAEAGSLAFAQDDRAPVYTANDFMEVKQYCREGGLYANAGETGIVFEIPWDEGAVSSPYGRTFLCQLSIDSDHPVLGKGLLSTLRIPINFAGTEEAIAMAAKLNAWELQSLDMPPFYGAWCLDPAGTSPAYGMFLPRSLCFPGMPIVIARWMIARAPLARSVIQLSV